MARTRGIEITDNDEAVVNPTVNDDINAGYDIGSRWTNTATGTVFFCSDSTAGAAVWKNVSAALYDAIVPDDFATPSAAFNDASAPKSVFVRDGVYVETAAVLIPDNGALIGESPDGAIIDLSSGDFPVGADGSGTDYSTGTVSVTNGSTTVTGAGGAAWQTAGIAAGEFILLGTGDKCWYEIASVDTETTITLVRTYQGATAAGETYEIKSLVVGVTIRDVTISGNTAGAGLKLTNCESAHIDNVHVTDCGVGGGTPEAAVLLQDTVDSFFRNLIVLGGPHHGIEIDDSNANTFDSFNVKGFAGNGVQIGGANQDCTFNSGHVCANNLNAFNVTGGSDETLISNCVISEQNGGGVNVDAGTGDCHVRNCTIRNNGTFGITFAGGGNSAEGNQVSSNGTTGIVAGTNAVIADNYVRGNGDVTANEGILVSGDNVVCTGNRVASDAGDGIEVTGTNCLIASNRVIGNTGTGILIGGAATGTRINGNLVTGNGTDFTDSGSNTRRSMHLVAQAVSSGNSSITGTTAFQTKLTFSPAGGPFTGLFKLTYHAEFNHDTAGGDTEVQLQRTDTGPTTLAFVEEQPDDADDWNVLSGFIYVTLTAESPTYAIQWRTVQAGNTANIRRARMEFVEVSK